MANSTTNLDLISQSQASKEVTANAMFDALSMAATYGRRQSTTSGLTWGYYGGNATVTSGTLTQISNGTVTLTASATNYLVAAKSTGSVSVSTSITNWNDTASYWKLYSIVAGASSVTSYTDSREFGKFAGIDAAYIQSIEKGAVSGVASLDASGKVPSAQLPSYVDDVLEYANLAAFPGAGATGVIYVAIDTNKTYRWSGSAYVYITSGAVDSVNGQTGVVTLDAADVGAEASGAVATHVGLSDPHTQYAKEADLGTMSSQSATSVNIDGGTIDGVVLGGAVPVEVHATTLSASGDATIGSNSGNPVVYINGTSAGNGGGYMNFQKAGVNKAYVGLSSAINGGGSTSDDMLIINAAGYGVTVTATGVAVTGALSATGNVFNNGSYTSFNGNGYIRGDAANIMRFQCGTSGYEFRDSANSSNLATLSPTGLSITGALSATGGFGIGTNSPAKDIDIRKGAGVAAAISLSGNGATVDSGNFEVSQATDGTCYVFNRANTNLVFGTNNTVGATLDAAGNLGLGIAPSAWDADFKVLQAGGGMYVGQYANGAAHFGLNTYFNGTNYIYTTSNYSTRYVQNAGGHTWYSAPSGTAGNPITFMQAMTLDASGNLLVGGDNVATMTDGFNYQPSGKFSVHHHGSGTASGTAFAYFDYAGSPIGSITQSGTTAVAYNTTSDHRLKTNVRPANATRFNDIEFVDFEWIDGRHDCGVIAHQLQSVYPDLVIGEKDATETRQVEIEPAIPAVTEQVLITEAIFNDDGEEIEPAVYETVEVTPAVEAITEDQEFPVYQQVNYIGLIGRMGTRIQIQDKAIQALEARLALLEAA